jgi:hypothetical protein
MANQNTLPHEGYVPAYQASAIPYVTGSRISAGETQEYTFEYATRFFNIKNRGASSNDEIAVAFTENGLATGNYFTLLQGEAFREEIRCVKLFISCSSGGGVDYELVVGLTSIPYRQFNPITSSNGYQGVG